MISLLTGIWFLPSYKSLFALPSVALVVMSVIAVGVSVYGLSRIRECGIRWLILLLFGTTVFGPIAFHTLGLAPTWAVGPKYHSTAVPYVILSAVAFVRSLSNHRLRVLAAVILAALVTLGSVTFIRIRETRMASQMTSFNVQALPHSDLVLLDTKSKALLFPVTSAWPSTQRILVGGQKAMIEKAKLAEAFRDEESVMYVTSVHYGNPEHERRILVLLQSEFDSPSPASTPAPLANLGWAGKTFQLYFFERHEDGLGGTTNGLIRGEKD